MKKFNHMKVRFFFKKIGLVILLIPFFLLISCGQSGPLFLPPTACPLQKGPPCAE